MDRLRLQALAVERDETCAFEVPVDRLRCGHRHLDRNRLYRCPTGVRATALVL